jgi:hypothetical protein
MDELQFQQNYEQMSDDQLAQILLDKQDLVPEAAAALDRIVQVRKISPPQSAQWNLEPGSSKTVRSLENYDEYRRLRDKKGNAWIWHFLALLPMALGIAIGRDSFGNSAPLVLLSLAWAVGISGYGLSLNFRFLAFRCPQCAERFGSRGECFNCGFPRSQAS